MIEKLRKRFLFSSSDVRGTFRASCCFILKLFACFENLSDFGAGLGKINLMGGLEPDHQGVF